MPLPPAPTNSDNDTKEPYRPKYHFTAQKNWINDPNGLVYKDGEYHLFFQHYPDDVVWGPMHWGHAVSRDLVKWEHLPIALYPDDLGVIYSGSAVIDHKNSAGFGENAIVAIFTHNNPDAETQSQSLAYSLDQGRSWTKYDKNPVLEPPQDTKDFRDPKVFWYEDENNSGHWVMCLAAEKSIYFYTSSNLKDWELSFRFGGGYGYLAGVWETPEFCKLKVKNGSDIYWLLSVGVVEGGPGGGSGTQYFVGRFDGRKFVAHYEKETVLWVDHGCDFYAVQSWNHSPDGRRIWIAWMNNWMYGDQIPTNNWRGAMTIPREINLIETEKGPRLVQSPLPELHTLRGRKQSWQDIHIEQDKHFSPDIEGECLEMIVEFEVLEEMEAECLGVRVRVGEEEFTAVGYWTKRHLLFTDRCSSGQTDFHKGFGYVSGAEFKLEKDRLRLHLFLDHCSLEVFADGGSVCFTNLIFPGENSLGVELFSMGGPVVVKELEIYEL